MTQQQLQVKSLTSSCQLCCHIIHQIITSFIMNIGMEYLCYHLWGPFSKRNGGLKNFGQRWPLTMTLGMRNIFALLSGDWMTLLSCYSFTCLSWNIVTMLSWYRNTFFPWNLSWHLGTVLLGNIVAFLLSCWFAFLMLELQ